MNGVASRTAQKRSRPKGNADERGTTPSTLAADLKLLEQFRWFRMALSERICGQSATTDEKTLLTLRQEPTLQLAEFLYLLDCQNIRDAEQVDRMAELHNAYVVDVTKDQAKMDRLGLNKDRLLDAIFTSDTRPRLLQNWREEPGAIDQSNLARFLGVVMSAETCRKAVMACANAGFLQRKKTPYGTYLVRSNGTLERIFGTTLHDARMKVP